MIAGGSGLIGRHLSAALIARGHEVLVLSRHPASVQTRLPGCAVLRWTEAIARASMRPKAFLSTSSLGPYGFRRDDQSLTEHSSPGIGPLSRDALELEARAFEAEALGTRVVLLRPGVVLAPDGGAFRLMTRAFGRGLGAR